MLAFFLTVALVPLFVILISLYFFNGITVKEFFCAVGVQLFIAGISALIVSCSNNSDVEILNGHVINKERKIVSCSHSYQCNCITTCTSDGKGGNNCTTICQTCYDHSYDINWNVYTSLNETISISRLDRQGLSEPPRWTMVTVGEPVSIEHSYTNYVKAAPGTLFKHQGDYKKYADTIPPYPKVYDYYKVNRFISYQIPFNDVKDWNSDLSRVNDNLGAKKQANIIVVVVKDKPQDWYYALEEAWIGGKKNDIIVVVSVNDELTPQWTNIMAWTTNELFKVNLRNNIMDLKKVSRVEMIPIIESNVEKSYARKPMKDFEYLSSTIKPSRTQWILTLFFGILCSIGMIYLFQTVDVFNENKRRRY